MSSTTVSDAPTTVEARKFGKTAQRATSRLVTIVLLYVQALKMFASWTLDVTANRGSSEIERASAFLKITKLVNHLVSHLIL